MVVPDPKYVLELVQAIVSAKESLANLQTKWDALFAAHPVETAASNKGGRKPDPDGYSTKALAAIESLPNETWNVDRVARYTGLTRKQVEKCLYNLCSSDKIRRVGRGQYAAITFPGAAHEASSSAAVN